MPQNPGLGLIDLTNFPVGAMLNAGAEFRRDLTAVDTLEDAAQRVVTYLHEHCVDPSTGERTCALVRFYKTHQYGDLTGNLRRIASAQVGELTPKASMRCLVLLGTAGDEPAWNAREASQGHKVIALPNAEAVRKAPMIVRLIEDLGLDVDTVVAGSPKTTRGDTRSYDVFHVEDAHGSPHIPAQREFVERYGIKSVVGFGGLLRSGELFAVIMFSRVSIPAASAARFRTIALDLRSALFPIDEANTWRMPKRSL